MPADDGPYQCLHPNCERDALLHVVTGRDVLDEDGIPRYSGWSACSVEHLSALLYGWPAMAALAMEVPAAPGAS